MPTIQSPASLQIQKAIKIFPVILLMAVLLADVAACSGGNAPALPAGDTEHSVIIDGVERAYLLHIPPGLKANQAVPVVFVFHGYDPETHFAVTDIQSITGFNDIADQKGFLVVYPYGISGSWNAGKCCGVAAQDNVNDTAFVRQMLVDLGTMAKIDPRRIFATGFTYGAMFSYRLACEMADTFAAVAPLAGVLMLDPCQPGQPVSILHIHGLKDTDVPFTGGKGGLATGTIEFPSVQQGIDTWVQADGCQPTPKTDKQGIANHTVYSSCRSGTAVELYTLDPLGNSWPTQYVFPAAQTIWDFFAAHPKK